jgi:SAM-dependent methyltransferase
MNVRYDTFMMRERRAQYVVANFSSILTGKILDVGCSHAWLRKLLPDAQYVGVDIDGNPDFQLNLEEAKQLPFGDNEFDCVVCTDVLEHLNNLHQIFDELVRVSRRHILVSLPNCWVNARRPIDRGYGSFAHYGLTADPRPDRHKWFFNVSDAVGFARVQAGRKGLILEDLHVTEKPRMVLISWARRLRYPSQERYLNRYAHTIWMMFTKQ